MFGCIITDPIRFEHGFYRREGEWMYLTTLIPMTYEHMPKGFRFEHMTFEKISFENGLYKSRIKVQDWTNLTFTVPTEDAHKFLYSLSIQAPVKGTYCIGGKFTVDLEAGANIRVNDIGTLDEANQMLRLNLVSK